MRFLSAKGLPCIGVVLMAATGLWAADVWAAEPASQTGFMSRATWDVAMIWVNFLILVAIIFKYGRTPLINFVKGEQAKTARTIQQVEEKKQLAEEKIREGQSQLQASEERLALIQERTVAEGKRRRGQMIAEAQEESRLMLAAARMRIDSQIREAHDTIRGELIDSAFEKAVAKLPQMMTDADQQQLIRLWMNEAQRLAET